MDHTSGQTSSVTRLVEVMLLDLNILRLTQGVQQNLRGTFSIREFKIFLSYFRKAAGSLSEEKLLHNL